MARIPSFFCFALLLCTCCLGQTPSGAQQVSQTGNASNSNAEKGAHAAAEAGSGGKTSEKEDVTPPAPVRLTAIESVVSKTETAVGFGDTRCDGNGNVYLGRSGSGDSIHKINSKGELVASFNPEANPDFEIYGVGHFYVTPDGEVYVPVGSKTSIYWRILVYKSDGSYSTNIKPDAGVPVAPATVAVFPNGNVLMTGNKLDRNSKLFIIPFAGIFRPDGKLLKKITLEQEEHLPDTSAMRNLSPGQPMPVISNRAVDWGQTQPASDGNIYIMRWGSPAQFYAVSPGGEVVKRFSVDPGSSSFDPDRMHISGGRIAVVFRSASSNEIMKIVDLDGQELENYEISPSGSKAEPLGVFACYTQSPERFTFAITNEDLKLKLKQVEAR